MSEPLVVEVERSGFVESRHLVDVAVVDDDGRVVYSAGDPSAAAAFRSSSKPIQARAVVDAGWMPSADEHLALACASHNGEPAHVDAVRALLRAADIAETALLTPLDVPAYPPAVLGITEPQRIFHNCSGKHAAMLGACAAAGWSFDDYRAPDHPLQRRIIALIADLTGVEPHLLVDGCGVPTTVAPLASLARAFRAIDGGPEATAMRAHPFMVAGTGRLDTDLMAAAPSILIKSGAEGLACLSVGPYGIALKSRDGSAARFRGPAVCSVLHQLELFDPALVPDHREVPILGGGLPVGVVRATGELNRR